MPNLQPKAEFEPVGVQPEDLEAAWKTAKPLIQKALDRGSNYTIDDVESGLRWKTMQLWTYGTDSALVTSIQSKGGKTWCLLLACGGRDMELWFPYFPLLEDWARSKGCVEVRVYGRLGWARYLKPSGYGVDWVKLRKEL